MLNWLVENWASLAVGLVVAAALAAVIIKLARDKKRRGGGCAGGCSGCPCAGLCHKS